MMKKRGVDQRSAMLCVTESFVLSFSSIYCYILNSMTNKLGCKSTEAKRDLHVLHTHTKNVNDERN